jgi:hypothetical protein
VMGMTSFCTKIINRARGSAHTLTTPISMRHTMLQSRYTTSERR